MSDRYENIRRALAMGPTPGPWDLKDGRTDTIENVQGYPVCTVSYHPDERYGHGVRAAYIAACDPDTIAALLKERDALRGLVSAITDNRDKCFIPTHGTDTSDALFDWDERARAALADGEAQS